MKKYLHALAFSLALISTSAWAQDQTIEIKEYKYVPEKVTIAAGTKITWINRDEVPHTVDMDDGKKGIKSSALDTDETFSYTFTTPGTYPYTCRLHSKMMGTIVVTDAK